MALWKRPREAFIRRKRKAPPKRGSRGRCAYASRGAERGAPDGAGPCHQGRIDFPSMRALRVSSLRRRVSDLRSSLHFRSCKRSSRWLAQFARECERDALVTTFYPCRHSCRAPDAVGAPSGQDEPVFGRGAPSIRTAVRMARPRKFTGASTNLQRLWLTALRAQISEAMSRAPWGSTPSSR